jgi:MOSC domain-containing protein YiiM
MREEQTMPEATVISIHIAETASGALKSLDSVRAVPGKGLEGDRYFAHRGTYSDTPGSGRDLTLVESEQLEAIEREHGIKLGPGESRRNLMTRGVSLNDLVDKEFSVGGVVVRGTRLCEPCAYLAEQIGNPAALRALVHRAGLRCDIVTEGTISVGDAIVVS